MFRTVVSIGAVPVTCVTPHAESQRVVAVSVIVLPAQCVGPVPLPVVLLGFDVLLEVVGVGLLLAVLSDPQAAKRRLKAVAAVSAVVLVIKAKSPRRGFNREASKINL